MPAFIALYTKPEDVEGFEEHYRSTHLPLAQSWPGLDSTRTIRFTGTPRGTQPPFHLAFVGTFASDDDLQEALASPAMRDAGRDAMEMVQRFGNDATLLIGEDF